MWSIFASYLSLNVEFWAYPNLFYINNSNTQTMVNIISIIFSMQNNSNEFYAIISIQMPN